MNRGKALFALGILLLVFAVIGLSLGFTRFWCGGLGQAQATKNINIRFDMTVAEFGRENGLSREALWDIFGLSQLRDYGKKIGDFDMPEIAITGRARKALSLNDEYGMKNWVKIPIKFGLWLAMMIVVFRLLRFGALTAAGQKRLYLSALMVFGVILGSEPGPMNTLKDTIALYGASGIIFPPRLAMLLVFLAIVVIANKFICGWGCQFGTLQDFLFRMSRDKDSTSVVARRKIPFAVTNTVRAAVFILFTSLALGWGMDILGPVDPFKIYNPARISGIGAVFLAVFLGASLFVYRPWCHVACPFGFLGWLAEKASLFKIKVNYGTCIACEKCAAACPSTVMTAILKQDRTIPDCFSCGSCIEACPTKSISFSSGKRDVPPSGKFS